MKNNSLGVVVAALALCVACGTSARTPAVTAARTLPFYDSADFTPKWHVSNASTFHQIRPFRLLDQDNAAFTERDLAGRIAVVDFFFTTCPGICPTMAVSMRALQREFLDDDRVILLSHSVTPETDTVEVLQQYATDHDVNAAKWKLLTGAKSEIYDLGRRFYFVDEDLGAARTEDDFLHTENFVLIDADRRIRGIYNGLDPDSMRALAADIRLLEDEQPARKGGFHGITS